MIKNSDKLNYLNESNYCADKIKSSLINNINQADRNKGILGLIKNEDSYQIKEIDKMPGQAGQFAGLITVETSEANEKKLNIYYKENTAYYHTSVKLEKTDDIKDSSGLSSIAKDAKFDRLTNCSADEGTDIFSIRMANRYNNRFGNFDIELNDILYANQRKQVYSRLYLHEEKIYD
jgi:hypothetical protein